MIQVPANLLGISHLITTAVLIFLWLLATIAAVKQSRFREPDPADYIMMSVLVFLAFIVIALVFIASFWFSRFIFVPYGG